MQLVKITYNEKCLVLVGKSAFRQSLTEAQ